MSASASTPVEVDGAHPVRSVFRLLGRYRQASDPVRPDLPHQGLAAVAHARGDGVGDRPRRRGRAAEPARFWAAVAFVALAQNYPMHVLWTRLFMGAVRHSGADLRNALAARLQTLSIGFHTRVSASIVQSKVVRDVENIELMLQQVTHAVLAQTMVITGAIVVTAITMPYFLPVYALTIPIAVFLRWMLASRSRRRNEAFRRDVEVFSSRVGEMATLMPITRAHGLEETAQARVAEGAEGVRDLGLRARHAQRPVPVAVVGRAAAAVGRMPRDRPRGSRSPTRARSPRARSCSSRPTSDSSPAASRRCSCCGRSARRGSSRCARSPRCSPSPTSKRTRARRSSTG